MKEGRGNFSSEFSKESEINVQVSDAPGGGGGVWGVGRSLPAPSPVPGDPLPRTASGTRRGRDPAAGGSAPRVRGDPARVRGDPAREERFYSPQRAGRRLFRHR